MHPPQVRALARALLDGGATLSEASRELGVSREAMRRWRSGGWLEGGGATSECVRCRPDPTLPADTTAYAYLLGQYLGDGCLSSHRRGVYRLRIACCDAYPGIMDECEAAIVSVRPGPVQRTQCVGCTEVGAYSKHWPCLFPQHGPGVKHRRAIVLEPWQEEIVADHPGLFLRGLIHSDGCRVVNWATTSTGRRYDGYVRYFFTNESTDVRGLCCQALDRLGLRHTHPKRNTISVARRADVAVLDAHVGPKG